MKNLIRKILREEFDDFDWVGDLIDNVETVEIPAGILWYRANYGKSKSVNLKKRIMPILASEFSDINLEGDRIMMTVDGFCDFTGFFKNDDNLTQYGIVNSWLVEKIFCDENNWWEPYNDTYGSWFNDVWLEGVVGNNKLYEYILKHIKKEYVIPDNYNPKQLDIFGNLPEKREIYYVEDLMSGGKERLLDNEYFNWLTENPESLGRLIDDDDTFLELKREFGWAYDSAYNVATTDNIYKSIKEAITDVFGQPIEGTTTNEKGRTKYFLKFDITDLFEGVINDYFYGCFEHCLNNRKVENPEEYCDDCHDFDSYLFKSLFENMLTENGQLWSPRFDEYPSRKEVLPYFEEDVYDRI
jgi:hypothetical protein